jgi:peptidoglycan-N-acetylglucosamine deacetylase
MRVVVATAAACVFASAAVAAAAAECPAGALGTPRTISLDPSRDARVGLMQYADTLPLADKEVVLTFDDGPLPPYSNRILDLLAAECVKATFFIVGRQAQEYPELVRRAYDEGHTIATHSQNHPYRFDRLPTKRATEEIEEGIASTAAALGGTRALAPFFRVPGLRTSLPIERYLAARTISLWSSDVVADDWRHIRARQVVQRALHRLAQRGKGVLLLHDIQPATALALPDLLKELKARGYRIVHVVPVPTERPTVATTAQPAELSASPKRTWPRTVETPERGPTPSADQAGLRPRSAASAPGEAETVGSDISSLSLSSVGLP